MNPIQDGILSETLASSKRGEPSNEDSNGGSWLSLSCKCSNSERQTHKNSFFYRIFNRWIPRLGPLSKTPPRLSQPCVFCQINLVAPCLTLTLTFQHLDCNFDLSFYNFSFTATSALFGPWFRNPRPHVRDDEGKNQCLLTFAWLRFFSLWIRLAKWSILELYFDFFKFMLYLTNINPNYSHTREMRDPKAIL